MTMKSGQGQWLPDGTHMGGDAEIAQESNPFTGSWQAAAAAAAVAAGGGGADFHRRLNGVSSNLGRLGLSRRHAEVADAALKAGLIPWFVFLLTSLLTMLLWHPAPWLTRSLCVLSFALCLLLAMLSASALRLQMGCAFLACALAVALGSAVGLYNYYVHALVYWTYDDHHQYANVWPSEPAAAHRDASAVVFAEGTGLDLRLAGSFKGAYSTFCVVPVARRGAVELDMGEIQYWAVGRDCCPGGKFFCGAAQDPVAHGGLVVYDRKHPFSGFVAMDTDMYMQAVHAAGARFGIASAERPLFIRWTMDLDSERKLFLRRAWLAWLGWGLITLPLWLLLSPGMVTLQQAQAKRWSVTY